MRAHSGDVWYNKIGIGVISIFMHLPAYHTGGSFSLKYIIFKPREHERNFIFSVLMTTFKMLFFVILLIGLIGGGLVAGIAKGWVDTSPNLDLAAIGAQSQTSFIYDRSGNLIMEFKGSENRIYVEI